jgi:phenylacetate-CoA ligase
MKVDRLHGLARAGYTAAFFVVAKPLISARRRWLQRWYSLDDAARAAERDRMLVNLYRFAWDHVPFYRRLYEGAGLARGDVAGLGDLGRLPTVSKAMLRAAPLRDLRPPRRRVAVLMKMTTSGSSGAPFAFYRSLDLLALNGAQMLAYLDRWGVAPRRSVMFVLYNTDPTIGLPIREGTAFTPFSSVGSTDPRLDVASIAAHLERQRPDCLVAYPHVVEDLADHLVRTGATYPREICVATGAEVVTDRLRRKAAAAFPAGRLYDMYNAVETGMMAAECPHGTGRHVNDYAVVLEDGDRVVDADGTAYVAPVITNLWNYGTPIIRYTGVEDLLEIGPAGCACGLGARSIARVVGRRSEFIRRPDGRSVSVTVLGSAHADLVGVERFQYVQADPAALVLRYVPMPGADRAAIARQAEAAVRRHLGTAIRFSCEAVASMAADPATLKMPLLVRG